jgi:hypothetical protein
MLLISAKPDLSVGLWMHMRQDAGDVGCCLVQPSPYELINRSNYRHNINLERNRKRTGLVR